MLAQYAAYCESRKTMTVVHPESSTVTSYSYNFWRSNSYQYPELSSVALWWLSVPTSSTFAERIIGIGRLVKSSQRGSLSWASFGKELKYRVNRPILDEMMVKLQHDINTCKVAEDTAL